MKTFSCCVPSLTSTYPSSWVTTCPCSTVSRQTCSQAWNFLSQTTRSSMNTWKRPVSRWTCSVSTSSWKRFNRFVLCLSFKTLTNLCKSPLYVHPIKKAWQQIRAFFDPLFNRLFCFDSFIKPFFTYVSLSLEVKASLSIYRKWR